jgi:SET domain-containing protein
MRSQETADEDTELFNFIISHSNYFDHCAAKSGARNCNEDRRHVIRACRDLERGDELFLDYTRLHIRSDVVE